MKSGSGEEVLKFGSWKRGEKQWAVERTTLNAERSTLNAQVEMGRSSKVREF